MKRAYIFASTLVAFTCLPVYATIINIPGDYPTIQQGINSSTDGDTVLVQPGTYYENINFNGHNIVLGSLFLTTRDTAYIAETVIDGDSSGSVVTFENEEQNGAVIKGLTLESGGYLVNGGGILCLNSNPIISNNRIQNNAAYNGAGIFLSYSNPIIIENSLEENQAFINGGGIFSTNSNPILIGNSILGNHAEGYGGGLFCSYSSPTLEDDEFRNNSAGESGGAIHCRNESLPTILNSLFSGNFATIGAGIHCDNSGLILTNCTISINWAGHRGGALAFEDIDGNQIELRNNIIWANDSGDFPEIFIDGATPVYTFYCNIQGGWEFGDGNIDSNPLFLDANNRNFNVCLESPCIDSGDPDIIDPDGSRSDMGYYYPNHPDCEFGNLWFVSILGNDTTGDGSIQNPFRTIQYTIDIAMTDDTILVDNGVYQENIRILSENITLASNYLFTGDTLDILNTVIDADSISYALYILGCNSNSSVIGFKISNGANRYAIECRHSATMVLNNIIESNWSGGVACIGDSRALISGNHIRDNMISGGSGIYCAYSSPVIVNNNITRNSISNFGGAGVECVNNDESVIIAGNIIWDNYAGLGAGGILMRPNTNGTIINNVIFENRTIYGTGGIQIWSFTGEEQIHIINNIVRNNENSQIFLRGNANPFIYFNNIQGGWEGEGNIDSDPLFRDPENGDFHLMSTECGDLFDSPCIDAGHPDILDSLLDCSWGLGELRSDMGAYGGGDSVTVSIDNEVPEIPNRFALAQNYPNPFNALTVIRYSLPEPSDVIIEIFDILGRRVETLVQGEQQAGYHQIAWDASDHSSGMYFYRIQAGDYADTKKMVLLK